MKLITKNIIDALEGNLRQIYLTKTKTGTVMQASIWERTSRKYMTQQVHYKIFDNVNGKMKIPNIEFNHLPLHLRFTWDGYPYEFETKQESMRDLTQIEKDAIFQRMRL